MPRPRKSGSSSSQSIFSAGQAKYVLERLIGDRRITSADVKHYVSEMHNEIGELERRLQSLKEATGDAIRGAIEAITPGRRRPGRPAGSGAKKAAGSTAAPAGAETPATSGKKRRKARITPEQLASRKLQGRYLGLIRQIPATRRAQYQKIAKDRGREAAIREMQSILNK